jgi:hypothetical protein
VYEYALKNSSSFIKTISTRCRCRSSRFLAHPPWSPRVYLHLGWVKMRKIIKCHYFKIKFFAICYRGLSFLLHYGMSKRTRNTRNFQPFQNVDSRLDSMKNEKMKLKQKKKSINQHFSLFFAFFIMTQLANFFTLSIYFNSIKKSLKLPSSLSFVLFFYASFFSKEKLTKQAVLLCDFVRYRWWEWDICWFYEILFVFLKPSHCHLSLFSMIL